MTSSGPGLIPALVMLAFSRVDARSVVRTALEGMVYSLCISSLCWWIIPRIAPRFMRRQRFLRGVTLVASILALAVCGCAIASVFLLAVGVTAPDDYWIDFLISLKLSVVLTLIFGVITNVYELIVGRLNAATRDAEQLRQMATEARLSSLESRVHPHFLFNTLNSISSLIREDPAQAERMVERLASLLRFSLDANESRLVPLSLELKIVRDYLEIERARFGERLRYRIDVPAHMNDMEIPPMSVQILVENSVKHAVSTRREGATVEVLAYQDHLGARVIDVIDDGPGFDPSAVKSGHGIDLLGSRLNALIGPEAVVRFASGNGRTRTSVVLA